MKPFLAELDKELLTNWLKEQNQPSFRGKQILDWIYKKRELDVDKMLNLPAVLREKLTSSFQCQSAKIEFKNVSPDQTSKLLIRLHDGESIESVIIPSKDRQTFCLSTQVGCPVSCYFCTSGKQGLIRNLKAGEIIEQLFLTAAVLGNLPDNIVFMGIGEGLLNFKNLSKALSLISSDDYIGFGARRITVSTSGWVPGIKQLAELRKQWTLAISLHAPNDEIRAKIIPENYRFPLDEILDAACYYEQMTSRMVTFEYVLLKGINDSAECAGQLAKIAAKCHAKINLIPFNSGDQEGEFQRPANHVIDEFADILRSKRAAVTIRQEKGSSINAACGQLRMANS